MSVLIKGMEMPTSCNSCPLLRRGIGDIVICVALATVMPLAEDSIDKRDDCPLVPVPPHGDLIDRNKLYEKTAEWEAQALHMVEVTMNEEDTAEWRKWSTVLTERSAFKFDVADAPTIIEGDEE